MPDFLLSYSLRSTNGDDHEEYLTQARAVGWYGWIRDRGGTWYRLPNGTLIGTFETKGVSNAARKFAIMKARDAGRAVIMDKWIICERSSWAFDSDERMTDDAENA